MVAVLLMPATAVAQGRDKLDPILRARARQLLGRSRVIVDYKGAPDIRAITQLGGRSGRDGDVLLTVEI